MMRLLTFLLLSAILAVPALAGPLAVVVRTKGEVWLDQGRLHAAAKSGDLLQEGARLSTGNDGRVLLRFLADRSIAELKPGSVVQFHRRVREDGTLLRRVFVHAGDAAFGVTPGKGRDLRFESATTVASVRGTQFSMAVEGRTTRLGVAEGTVRVCHASTGSTVHVPSGGEVVVTDEGIAFTKGEGVSASDSARYGGAVHRFGVEFQGPARRKALQVEWDSTTTTVPAVRRYDPQLFQLATP